MTNASDLRDFEYDREEVTIVGLSALWHNGLPLVPRSLIPEAEE